jgi:hypothetical protein
LDLQVRYDDELQSYLKSQGLRSLKQKAKKKPEQKQAASAPAASVPAVRRDAASAAISAQPPPAHSTPAATQQQQLAQAFMGLPIAGMGGGLPMAVGMPPGMMGMLPHFSQVHEAKWPSSIKFNLIELFTRLETRHVVRRE